MKLIPESEVKNRSANSRGDIGNQEEALTTVSNPKSKGIERPEEDTRIGSTVKRVLGSEQKC